MNNEQYELWDYTNILKKARKYEKQIPTEYNAKVAFLGTCSMQIPVSVSKFFLQKHNICADIYEGEFNGIKMDVYDENSPFYQFEPEYIVILPDYRDIQLYPNILDTPINIDKILQDTASDFINIFEKIHKKLPQSQILCSNIIIPYERTLGNLECNYLFSKQSFLKQLNIEVIKKRPSYVTYIDMESIAEYVGKQNWFDESSYFLNKSGFSLKYIGLYCDAIIKQILALKGVTHKCLVLDLDNTLWGGVVGDDGYDGIILDPNDAIGEAFLAFQKYILELKQRGIILAVCSKNDLENAKEPFEKNEHMLLKYDDFACFVANWNDKVSNLKLIAKNLNIGIDSLVFFDDNPTERELVKTYLPEVYTVNVPEDPAYYVRALDESTIFDWLQLTSEDIGRSQSYIDNIKREELMLNYDDYEAYLKALNLYASSRTLCDKDIARFSQLINKSNQFNLRTRRYSEAQINDMLSSDEYELLTISLKDKFSNYGIIACVILHFHQGDCFIDSWVMSCRVLKKNVEKYTLNKIITIAQARRCRRIIGEYIPTQKNSMVKELYSQLGFSLVSSDDTNKCYELVELKCIELNGIIKEIN